MQTAITDTERNLKKRTKVFAIRTLKLTQALPNTRTGNVIANQLARCATSVGSNYRAACRGRSKAEFIAKLGIVIEETDESEYWFDLIIDMGLLKKELVTPLRAECKEILAIMITSSKTAKTNDK